MTSAPEHGARFEIARDTIDGDAATYTIAVHEEGATHEARATISAATLETRWTREPPRWIADTTHGFLKTLQKNHAADASWPGRWVRWRVNEGRA